MNKISVVWIAGILLLGAGCRSDHGTERKTNNVVPARDIKTVMEAHVDELMAIPGIVGVAIGKLSNGADCIQILVVKKTAELERSLPKRLEGHPVVIRETGEIRGLSKEKA